MPGVANGNGPGYISAHSADVILSDIRPVKLKPEALSAINVLLDEFLHIILTSSRSLSTEKLRSSLLSVLPTSLGKEALLEAEVELRAYWERTNSRGPPEDDSRTFHLQWSFELLRLKCSAYSTLNEDDEDPTAEVRVNEIFSKAHSHPPQVGLLDPAALYLTAILESMCEHILSNVGRVAARDSSRTYATTNDLFVALCEDDSIYGFFRSMKVYHQIESMAEALSPKSRRSKSTSLRDHSSRTSSPHAELSSTTLSARSRPSSEGRPRSIPSPLGEPRTSGEKKLRRRDSGKGHTRNSSVKSDIFDEIYDPAEDAALQREFDDLMRSASTMKMSLTPDRLKTMEAYKQEKDQKSFSRTPFPVKPSGSPLAQRPSFGHLKHKSQDTRNRTRQDSVSSTSVSTFLVPARLRSLSTSGSSWSKLSRTPSIKTASKVSLSSSVSSPPSSDMPPVSRTAANDNNGFPKRTRVKGRRRESMDLDDILNGSDDDLDDSPVLPTRSPFQPPSTPKMSAHPPPKTSQGTRDMMDFLAEGPPEAPSLSRAGRELVDFLAEGPPNYASSIVSLDKSGGSGNRLQKMMSKLSLGYNEKAKGGGTMHHTRVESKGSNNTLSSLANKPIPPRPPRAPNAPSAFPVCDMADENKAVPQRTTYHDSPSRDPSSSVERLVQEPSKTIVPPIYYPLSSGQPKTAEKSSIPTRPTPSTVVQINGITNGNVPRATPPPRSSSQHALRPPIKATIPPPVTVVVQPPPTIAEPDIREMHRLLTNATTADECRLIFGMFMARNGISLEPKQAKQETSSPRSTHTASEAYLESSLVEALLGNSTPFDFAS